MSTHATAVPRGQDLNRDSPRRRWPDHRTVWCWHFYAGVVCIPFVLWLAATGSMPGATLLAVLALEKAVFSRWEPARRFLELRRPT